ncbi:hypothetical protein JCM10908_001223 [Rhodotorula pacifica]|uniref:uncharacterized protein n=1 Tax=Rhodotorula pacifica TaxID=1495444 RepID=UPI0031776607
MSKRLRQRASLPSPSPPPRAATIADLSEEAIDLVCAYIRDDPDVQVATDTLCRLARTAHFFHLSAKRALLYDPTRALSIGGMFRQGRRMSGFLNRLLSEPTLGHHVKRLDHLPDFWEDLADDITETDYANWMLVLSRLCPFIVSVAVSPFFHRKGSVGWSAFRILASKPSLKSLLFRLDSLDCLDDDVCILSVCQSFLAELASDGLESLQLPPLIDYGLTSPPSRPPIELPTKRIILHDMYSPARPDLLSQYFDFPNFFPRLTRLSLDHFVLHSRAFDDLVSQFPLLHTLDLAKSVWNECASSPDIWSDALALLPHLRTLRTGAIRCRTTKVCVRVRRAINSFCDEKGIDVICDPVLFPDRSDSVSSAESTFQPLERNVRCACCGTLVYHDSDADSLDDVHARLHSDDGASLLDGDDDGDWSRAWSTLNQDYDYGRFNRDGIPWHWVFDALGRPIAVPNDLAYRPAVECDTNSSSDEGEDDDRSCASLDFLPPLPDIPRLEDGYEALDDGSDASDSEDCGFGYAEPWRTWSEPCDFEEADAAWMRFDIDDEGKESFRDTD